MFYNMYLLLNRFFRLSFDDKSFEERFQQSQLNENLYQNIIAIKVAFGIYIGYYFVAYFMTPEDFTLNAFFILPVPLILSILFLSSTNKEHVGKSHLLKLFVFSFGIGFPPILNIATSNVHSQLYVTNSMLPIFSIFVMYGSPFALSLLGVLALFIFFICTLFFSDFEIGFTVYSLFLIFTTFVISATSGYLIEKSKRKNYLAIFRQEELNIKLKEEQEKNIQKEKILQQQTRLAQMGEMISMIAHQWRQPLGAISSSIFSIQTKEASGKFNLEIEAEREKFLAFAHKKYKNINEYVQILSSTIDDFRNFFKPDKSKELVNITTPIKRALHIVESSLNSKNITIISEFKCNDKISIFQNEMMQVILNILKNAEDNFIEKEIRNPKITIEIFKNNSTISISITDNGGGIPEDIVPNIFDPYFSTKDEKNGTGLGLYMSKIMIEEHNGGILEVTNSENGVSFIIKLEEQNG